MKAIVWTDFGPPEVLQLQEVAKPTIRDNDVLIKIGATTVTAGDCEIRSFKFPGWLWLLMRLLLGFRKPRIKIIGQELAGQVEAVGKAVTRFKVGDEIFGTTGLHFGAYAEYISLAANSSDRVLEIKPANMTFEEAAAVPVGALEALHFLKKGNVRRGEKVMIIGAGGSIGTFAVQLAKYYGAEVTGVDKTGKLEMLRSIGADAVIDYTQSDFTQSSQTYDVIYDVVGKTSFSGVIRLLKPNGRYLLGNAGISEIFRAMWTSLTSGKKVTVGAAGQKSEDLIFIKQLIEAGKITSVIDKRYPLAEIVEAHRYVESGNKKGNVVITL